MLPQIAQVIEAALNGVLVIDPTGRIVLANSEIERMFLHPRVELLGLPVDVLLPERFRAAQRARRAEFWRDPNRGRMQTPSELFGLRADGSEFPIEVGRNPIETADGPLVVAAVVDISDRRRAEAMSRNIVAAAPYGMLMADAKGKIVFVNRQSEALFGYEPDELLGRPLEVLLPANHRSAHAGFRHAYHAAPQTRGMAVGREVAALHKDGREIPVEIALSSVTGDGERMTLAVVTDISARRRMELELRQANAHLEEFVHIVSHDLKAPLRGIGDLVEWIGEDLDSDRAKVLHNLERIRVRTTRMEGIIDDLLAYARAGRAMAELDIVDPRALIDGILEVQPLPPGFAIGITVEAAPFRTARVPLETVLRNLLGNAVKHHDRDHGRIAVSASEDDSYCLFTIADDGPGIPSEAHDQIFKLFETLAPSQRGGSGIGLALTRRLVDSHGGRIALDDNGDRRGATFRVWWPRFARMGGHDR
jgi:PAS domain S-box-containing protein